MQRRIKLGAAAVTCLETDIALLPTGEPMVLRSIAHHLSIPLLSTPTPGQVKSASFRGSLLPEKSAANQVLVAYPSQ